MSNSDIHSLATKTSIVPLYSGVGKKEDNIHILYPYLIDIEFNKANHPIS